MNRIATLPPSDFVRSISLRLGHILALTLPESYSLPKCRFATSQKEPISFQQQPPLCKGGRATEWRGDCFTFNQSLSHLRCQLPLHKGAFFIPTGFHPLQRISSHSLPWSKGGGDSPARGNVAKRQKGCALRKDASSGGRIVLLSINPSVTYGASSLYTKEPIAFRIPHSEFRAPHSEFISKTFSHSRIYGKGARLLGGV